MGKLIPDGVKIQEEDKDYVHIEGETHSGMQTLCGWVDVIDERVDISEQPVNCPICIHIVRYCRTLTFRPRKQ